MVPTRSAAGLLRAGSLELGGGGPDEALKLSGILPKGTRVFLPHLPRRPLSGALACAIGACDAGFEPVVHLAARRVATRSEAASFLARAVREAGVRGVLLVGGDLDPPAGPYADASGLLADGIVQAAGIERVAFAVYPEGHPRIDRARLDAAFDAKFERARASGLKVEAISQFCFEPVLILDLARELAARHPEIPLRVGLAGPASPISLLKYARLCGVGASLRAASSFGAGALRLIGNSDPGPELAAIAANAPANVHGVHFFSFGGSAATAAWMRERSTA
jgi:methylenetetrahydrofolate reductase (NADPH)